MFESQRKLQTMLLGIDPQHMERGDLLGYIRDMTLACTDELHEALGETGWKPWATSRHINTEAFRDELTDAWLFLLNLMLASGMTSKDLFNRYHEKRSNAERRIETNYDGVSTKCPKCKRAYDNKAVMCYPATNGIISIEAWCSQEGTPNPHPDLGILQVSTPPEGRCPVCAQPYEENINGCCPPSATGYGWCGIRVQSIVLVGGERVA
jgi:hypothetical protein